MTWVMSLTVGRRCQIDTELDFFKNCSSKTSLKMAVFPQSTVSPPGTHLDADSCQTRLRRFYIQMFIEQTNMHHLLPEYSTFYEIGEKCHYKDVMNCWFKKRIKPVEKCKRSPFH